MQSARYWCLKIGGNQVEDETFLAEFVATVRRLADEHTIFIVHGGGKEIADLHDRLNVAFQTVEGLRVTSDESLRLVEMVLNGSGEHPAGTLAGQRRCGCHRPDRRGSGIGARRAIIRQWGQSGSRGRGALCQRRGAAPVGGSGPDAGHLARVAGRGWADL